MKYSNYLRKKIFPQNGFTLIEILTTVAIIGILSAVLILAINPVQRFKQSRDAQRESDMKQIASALKSYTVFNGSPPINRTPGSSYCSNHSDFLQELVTSGELSSMPKPPNTTSQYCYYDYGGSIGMVLATLFESISPTTIGPNESCRPFTTNLCSHTIANTYYCLCIEE